MSKITLQDLLDSNSTDECLTPQQVADVLDISKKRFIKAAKENPQALGFPVIQIGERIKIPKAAFINFMNGKSE